MIKIAHAVLAGSLLLLVPMQASALQLTNRDKSDHKLVVIDVNAGGEKELMAQPSQILDGFCLKGCTIRMSDGQEYEFDGNEIVSIEEGMIFMDGPFDSNDFQDASEETAESDADTRKQ